MCPFLLPPKQWYFSQTKVKFDPARSLYTTRYDHAYEIPLLLRYKDLTSFEIAQLNEWRIITNARYRGLAEYFVCPAILCRVSSGHHQQARQHVKLSTLVFRSVPLPGIDEKQAAGSSEQRVANGGCPCHWHLTVVVVCAYQRTLEVHARKYARRHTVVIDLKGYLSINCINKYLLSTRHVG